jgi:hypothetical protein
MDHKDRYFTQDRLSTRLVDANPRYVPSNASTLRVRSHACRQRLMSWSHVCLLLIVCWPQGKTRWVLWKQMSTVESKTFWSRENKIWEYTFSVYLEYFPHFVRKVFIQSVCDSNYYPWVVWVQTWCYRLPRQSDWVPRKQELQHSGCANFWGRNIGT